MRKQDVFQRGLTKRHVLLFIYATWSPSTVLVATFFFFCWKKCSMHWTFLFFFFKAAHILNASREAKRFRLSVFVRVRLLCSSLKPGELHLEGKKKQKEAAHKWSLKGICPPATVLFRSVDQNGCRWRHSPLGQSHLASRRHWCLLGVKSTQRSQVLRFLGNPRF